MAASGVSVIRMVVKHASRSGMLSYPATRAVRDGYPARVLSLALHVYEKAEGDSGCMCVIFSLVFNNMMKLLL